MLLTASVRMLNIARSAFKASNFSLMWSDCRFFSLNSGWFLARGYENNINFSEALRPIMQSRAHIKSTELHADRSISSTSPSLAIPYQFVNIKSSDVCNFAGILISFCCLFLRGWWWSIWLTWDRMTDSNVCKQGIFWSGA
jgi:hypothetical protein